MKKLILVIAVLAVTLASAAPASAVNRSVATTCYGSMIAQRFNPVVTWATGIPCNNYVPDPWNKPWYSVGRPDTDWYAADRGASHFWPGCSHSRYAIVDQRNQPGNWYYTYYNVGC